MSQASLFEDLGFGRIICKERRGFSALLPISFLRIAWPEYVKRAISGVKSQWASC
jgi:hypothetical protein